MKAFSLDHFMMFIGLTGLFGLFGGILIMDFPDWRNQYLWGAIVGSWCALCSWRYPSEFAEKGTWKTGFCFSGIAASAIVFIMSICCIFPIACGILPDGFGNQQKGFFLVLQKPYPSGMVIQIGYFSALYVVLSLYCLLAGTISLFFKEK